MTANECHTCTLGLVARGTAEPCPRERCAFWEAGGAVLLGGCVIERLGVDLSSAYLAGYLLEVRERLDEARDLGDANEMRRTLARRIGLEL
jgi:hypothetical protein